MWAWSSLKSAARIGRASSRTRADGASPGGFVRDAGGSAAPSAVGRRTSLPAETPLRATVLKGRTNYLCLGRWQTLLHASDLSPADRMLLIKTLFWLPRTATGDRAEVVGVLFSGHAGHRQHTPAAVGADQSILHALERRLRRLGFCGRHLTGVFRKCFLKRLLAGLLRTDTRLRWLIRLALLRERHSAKQYKDDQ